MLYSDFYNCYIRDTIAATLFQYGFRLASWPDDVRFYPEGWFSFLKEQVRIGVWVVPDSIYDVEIDDAYKDRGYPLDTVLKKRGMDPVVKRGSPPTTRFIRAERITEALIDHCQDVLAGKLPPELSTSKSKKSPRKRKQTFSDLYNHYIKNTLEKLLLKHDFELVARPNGEVYYPGATFAFRRGAVEVVLKVSPEFIYGATIVGPLQKDSYPVGCPLPLLLRKRGCDPGPLDHASTRIAMMKAISNALQECCPDVLAGTVPRELLEMLEEHRIVKALREAGGTSKWVPPTTPSPRPRRQRVSLSMLAKKDAHSSTLGTEAGKGKRRRSKPTGDDVSLEKR